MQSPGWLLCMVTQQEENLYGRRAEENCPEHWFTNSFHKYKVPKPLLSCNPDVSKTHFLQGFR